jgi:hypothetical protein
MRHVYAAVCFEGSIEELLKDVEQRVVRGVERIRAGARAFPPNGMNRRQLEKAFEQLRIELIEDQTIGGKVAHLFYEGVQWPRSDRRYFLMRDPTPFME